MEEQASSRFTKCGLQVQNSSSLIPYVIPNMDPVVGWAWVVMARCPMSCMEWKLVHAVEGAGRNAKRISGRRGAV